VTEALGLVAVAWLVYVCDALWWVGPDRIVLTGRETGRMRAQLGPVFPLRGEAGVFVPRLTPTFEYSFEVSAASAGGTPASEAALVRTANAAIAAARPLQYLGAALWGFCFLVAPALMLGLGLSRVWIALVAVLFSGAIAIVMCFARAWRTLRANDRNGWKSEALPLILSPLAAIRAADTLTRKTFAGCDALAVVSALATVEEFLRIARLQYFAPGDDRLEALLAARNLKAALLAPPVRSGADMKGYCPRCHVQLVRDSGECPECPEIQVRAFGSALSSSKDVTPSGELSGRSRSAAQH
jgi:hypothetical protein